METSLPPRSDDVTYDPPVLGHLGMKPELVVREPTDERVWVEIEPNVWFRPLFFDMNNGSHGEVLRVRRGGVLSRHRHPSPHSISCPRISACGSPSASCSVAAIARWRKPRCSGR